MNKRFISRSLSETEAIASSIASQLTQIDGFMVWLQGDLGVGKTTLIRAILENFGVRDAVSSPTFTYLNEYESPEGDIFAHLDLYRLEGQNAQDILDHLEYGRHRGVFVEWPQFAQPPRADMAIHLSFTDDAGRLIKVN